MQYEKMRKIIGVILLVSLIALGFLKPVQSYINLPKELVFFEGQETEISTAFPVFAEGEEAIFSIKDTDKEGTLSVSADNSGEGEMEMQMSGFPVKKVDVKVLPDFKVIPGGQSIGVRLNTKGVLVVGHHLVNAEKGKVSPGENAGIKVGDMITKINGQIIQNMGEVAPFVKEAGKQGKKLKLEIKRKDETLIKELKPAKDKNDKSYRMGLYIRDSAAGIGTMTFYEPKSKKYGALGHVISDMDTKEPIVVHDGKIVRSLVTDIEKGSNGKPGEKLARFSGDREVIGNITRNSPFGIFGELNKDLEDRRKPMPITLPHQVKEGPAKILTVVDGQKVKEFDVEIVSTVPQKFPATKGMVIKITDKELLDKTGGIVQGMSGSPIIQDGKVVGAVTHVFVNDPTSGYGVHIEWMLREAGIDIYSEEKGEERKAS